MSGMNFLTAFCLLIFSDGWQIFFCAEWIICWLILISSHSQMFLWRRSVLLIVKITFNLLYFKTYWKYHEDDVAIFKSISIGLLLPAVTKGLKTFKEKISTHHLVCHFITSFTHLLINVWLVHCAALDEEKEKFIQTRHKKKVWDAKCHGFDFNDKCRSASRLTQSNVRENSPYESSEN